MYVRTEKILEDTDSVKYRFYTDVDKEDGIFIIDKNNIEPFEYHSCKLIKEIGDFPAESLYKRAIASVYREYKKNGVFPQKASWN